ncbi:UNVERIFIED_CONTAM: hypothetical protein Sradi_6971900 [Sesamum radiatum]|uniref:Reverse transcriptase zinc-binding domain-containing protein n=1 Tax=Sesamum radiatum TaxID=300843 RepID=A0AAW2JEQ2_SESRA
MNQALMMRHIWRILQRDPRSIWVAWVLRYRLRSHTLWTSSVTAAPWCWRKLLKLCPLLRDGLEYRFSERTTHNGAAGRLNVEDSDSARPVELAVFDRLRIQEIVSDLPLIYPHQTDEIKWKLNKGMCSTSALLSLLQPTSPRVAWHLLLSGKFKIPRHGFVLWLAFLERLSTMDRIWAPQANSSCVLCGGLAVESHSHMFFECSFSQRCLMILKRRVRFCWVQRGWQTDILWASRRWRGTHLLNMTSRAMLAAIVYHIWGERNSRRFLATSSSADSVAARAIEEVRLE